MVRLTAASRDPPSSDYALYPLPRSWVWSRSANRRWGSSWVLCPLLSLLLPRPSPGTFQPHSTAHCSCPLFHSGALRPAGERGAESVDLMLVKLLSSLCWSFQNHSAGCSYERTASGQVGFFAVKASLM